MPKPPIVKTHEVVAAFRRAGFIFVKQEGSHMKFRHSDGRMLTIVDHGGRDYPPGTLRKHLSDTGISVTEFIALLRE